MKIVQGNGIPFEDFDGRESLGGQEVEHNHVITSDRALTTTTNGASTSPNAAENVQKSNYSTHGGIASASIGPDVPNLPSGSRCRSVNMPFYDLHDLMEPLEKSDESSDEEGYAYAGLHGPLPLTETEIRKIATVQVSGRQVRKKKECAICIEVFQSADVVSKLPCSHIYHVPCIKSWLRRHGICPICRTLLYGLKSYDVGESELSDVEIDGENANNSNDGDLDETNNSSSESAESEQEVHNHDSSAASEEFSDDFMVSENTEESNDDYKAP